MVPAMSSVGQAFRCAEFGLPPWRVPVLGAPRNDRMLQADPAQVRAALGVPAGECALVWMPTFRHGRNGRHERTDSSAGYAGLPFTAAELLELDGWLGDHGARIYVKLHRSPSATTGCRPGGSCHWSPPTSRAAASRPTRCCAPSTRSSPTPRRSGSTTCCWTGPSSSSSRHRRVPRAPWYEIEPIEQWLPGGLATSMDAFCAELLAVVEGRDPHAAQRSDRARLLHRFTDDGSARRIVDHVIAGAGGAGHA